MKKFILFLLLPCVSFAGAYPTDYEYIAASQTSQKLGPVGGKGDVIEKIIIIPETTGAGTVSLRDGSGAAAPYNTNLFVSGTLSDLSPIVLDLGMRSVSADFSITTGANVHVIAIGSFK